MKDTNKTVRSLSTLPEAIERKHTAAVSSARRALIHARQCGALLAETQEQVPHGQWLDWLQSHTTVSPRTAQRYMRLDREWDTIEKANTTPVSHLGLRQALDLIAEERPPSPDRWDDARRRDYYGTEMITEAVDSMARIVMLAVPEASSVSEAMEVLRTPSDARERSDDAAEQSESARLEETLGPQMLLLAVRREQGHDIGEWIPDDELDEAMRSPAVRRALAAELADLRVAQ